MTIRELKMSHTNLINWITYFHYVSLNIFLYTTPCSRKKIHYRVLRQHSECMYV